jgi:hypothetical protein
MAIRSLRPVLERLAIAMTVLVCAVVLVRVGRSRDLQDFAVIVSLFLLAPVWLVVRLRPARAALTRWALAAALWCGLWAIPLLWKRPWAMTAVVETIGQQFNWWRTVAPDLLPFFALPLVALLLVTILTPSHRVLSAP